MSAQSAEHLPRTRSGRPKLRRTDDVLDYWAERIALVAPEREYFECSSMICRGDSLFHYGTHFELARIMRDKRGRTRLVLLNGDSYSGGGGHGPSTSSRQADTRRAVEQTNAPHVVVPFSALQGARIDFGSIAPIHVRDDRFITEQHSSRKRPTDLASPNQTLPFNAGHGWCYKGAQLGEDGVWRWEVERHWLGDSIFRARTTERRTRKATPEELGMDAWHRAWQVTANRRRRAEREARHRSWALSKAARAAAEDGNYRRMTRALFAAQGLADLAEQREELSYRHRRIRLPANPDVRNGRVAFEITRWATFLSSFDYQEARPLYFLCELPYGAKPNTVDEAIEALKPPEVVAALARGLKVIRQGDLFAIPTQLTKRQIRRMAGRADFTKRLRVLGTNHSVTEGIVLKGGAVLGRGIMRHEPEGGRPPDHAQQKLGDRWHLLVRNTVPRTR